MSAEFQFDVFLSHNQADKPRVRRLAERLRAAGLRVWFDEWVIQPGDDIYLAIERGLEASRTLVLCLSPTALGSDWVTLERSTVLFRDPSNAGRRFIPLLLANCKLPDTLRRLKYVDYRGERQAAFAQVLDGCRSQEPGEASPVLPKPVRKSRSRPKQNQEENRRRPEDEAKEKLPSGVKLVRTLRGHTDWIGRIAWSPDGRMLASPSADKTIRLWDPETGECLRTLEGHKNSVKGVAFDPQGRTLASGAGGNFKGGELNLWDVASGKLLDSFEDLSTSFSGVAFSPTGKTVANASTDHTIRLWDLVSGRLRFLGGHSHYVDDVTFSPRGDILATSSYDQTVKLWDTASCKLLHSLEGHSGITTGLAFISQGRLLASSSGDGTAKLWDASTGELVRTLEGHTEQITAIAVTADEGLLATRSSRGDGSVGLWRSDTWACIAKIPGQTTGSWPPGLAFHPRLPLLATVGSDPGTWQEDRDRVIHIYELDLAVLLGQVAEPSAHYVNAKVVLVGDTGVGKTGLSLVLNNQPFEATDSTPGRRIWTLDSREVLVGGNVTQTRETLLWDLAGQPGYRVIHQLHLKEVAVALVVFDARSETDPLAGVRHWERALRLAQQRQGPAGVPMKKFLVSARNDRGGVSIGEERLKALLDQFGFDGYFKTSAKESWQIKELRATIEQAIAWEKLPEVSSSQLFADIKSFLLEVKKTGRLLAPASQLYDEFACQHPDTAAKVANLRDQFETCIGRLENRDLIRRLTFGGYVLLQPELLDAYASAMVNTAKEEPDGLGSLAEEIALAGKFFVPEEQKITDPGQEQLLLHATVEELVRHDLALRENADDGRYLVFPSQFNRDYEDAPEPKGKAVAITFDGPVQSLYSTLAVRLGHSGLFTTGRAEMWRNAAVFTAKAGGKCGLFLHEFAEARGRLILFFDEHASTETRFHFEEFVLAHAKRRALDDTVDLVRFFVCPDCGDPVPDSYVKRLREKGTMAFNCPCGGTVSLAEPKERFHFQPKVEAMNKYADAQRDFEVLVASVRGSASTPSFENWRADERSRFEQAVHRWKAFATEQKIPAPECFISYAWGNPVQEHWVQYGLATDLLEAGIKVVLDRWENARIGASVPRFVERVAKCDRVIVVGTPLYRTKYENNEPMRGFVVAAEGDLIGHRMIGTETQKESVLPVLLEGTAESSFPYLLRGRVYADFRNREAYFDTVFELILSLYQTSSRHPLAEGLRESLAEPKERIRFLSKMEAMDKSADRQRDFNAFVMSATGETSTASFHEWAGGERFTLAIVFTDVVGSTAMGQELRDEAMNEVRRAHFAQSRKLIGQFEGREIKIIGDSFMAAFKSVDAALDYARALQGNTGHAQVQIRVGIHIGPMHVEEGDVFGGTVNFAARVIGAIKGAEIWLSDRAKEDIDRLGATQHKRLRWERHDGVAMKGFPGVFTLWSLSK